jgi:hypothetical protein
MSTMLTSFHVIPLTQTNGLIHNLSSQCFDYLLWAFLDACVNNPLIKWENIMAMWSS